MAATPLGWKIEQRCLSWQPVEFRKNNRAAIADRPKFLCEPPSPPHVHTRIKQDPVDEEIGIDGHLINRPVAILQLASNSEEQTDFAFMTKF